MRACVPFVLSYQAAIPIRLESHPKQLELVGDTDLYTGDAVTAFVTVISSSLFIIVIGISNVTVNRCTFGQVVGIANSVFQVVFIVIPASNVFNLVVVDGSIQTAWAKSPFQTQQPVLLFGLFTQSHASSGICGAFITQFPAFVFGIFISQRNTGWAEFVRCTQVPGVKSEAKRS